MSEKFPIPQAERLVGKEEKLNEEAVKDLLDIVPVDEEGEVITDVREVLRKAFNEKAGEVVEALEIPKTERDEELIGVAESAVKEYAQALGRADFVDFPLENIHLLKEDGVKTYTKKRFKIGSHSTVMGHIVIDRRGDIETAITTFHELWHALASYSAIQVKSDGYVSWYRSGLAMNSRNGKDQWFGAVDEGLVGLATKKFFEEKVKNNPLFKEELEALKQEGKSVDTTRQGEVVEFFKLVKSLYEKNKETFSSEDEVVTLFQKAQVSGNILSVARLIEKTFGKGMFRKLGELSRY